MVVVWSKLAETELKKVHKYISLDSPQNAKKVVTDIIDATIALAKNPENIVRTNTSPTMMETGELSNCIIIE